MTSEMASEKATATRELQHTTVATTWYHGSPAISATYSTSLANRFQENISRAVEAAENNVKAAETKQFIPCSLSSFCSFLLFSVLIACQNIKNRFQTTQPACSSLFAPVQSTAEYLK